MIKKINEKKRKLVQHKIELESYNNILQQKGKFIYSSSYAHREDLMIKIACLRIDIEELEQELKLIDPFCHHYYTLLKDEESTRNN